MLKVFQVKKGDQFSFIVNFKNLNQDLSSLDFGLKVDYTDPMLVLKTLDDGVTQIDTTHYAVSFTPEDTSGLEVGMYIFDLRYTIGDTPKTPVSGYLIINDTVFNEQEGE